MVHSVDVILATSDAFQTACTQVGLRSNPSKETLTPGSKTNRRALPIDYKVDLDPKALKHGPTPIPAVPSRNAEQGSQLDNEAAEVKKLVADRNVFPNAGHRLKDSRTLPPRRPLSYEGTYSRRLRLPRAHRWDPARTSQAARRHLGRNTFPTLLGPSSKHIHSLIFIPQAQRGYGFTSIAAIASAATAALWYTLAQSHREHLQTRRRRWHRSQQQMANVHHQERGRGASGDNGRAWNTRR